MDRKSYEEEALAKSGAKMEETREHAAQAVHTATEAGGNFVDNQKRIVAVEVDGYACALREAARQLHDQNQEGVAGYVDSAASGLDRLAVNLRDRDIRYTFDRLSDFARRQPALFLSGAVATGFLLTRFMKSSSSELGEGESPMEMAKEKVASGIEKTKEKMSEKKEEMKPSPEAEKSEHYTAADVEIPVILKPHEQEPPKGPSPNR